MIVVMNADPYRESGLEATRKESRRARQIELENAILDAQKQADHGRAVVERSRRDLFGNLLTLLLLVVLGGGMFLLLMHGDFSGEQGITHAGWVMIIFYCLAGGLAFLVISRRRLRRDIETGNRIVKRAARTRDRLSNERP